ncbi:uncharacterized protein BDZ83DRAFT_754242 [Colletotrichum acutatum]|uniref:Uncharacterized protein n=1 Tax=Glomerella acutata TaxID=27357 RepID=A0AAD8ULA0_GLOAC|nr:uncharacterized protein BDZ83DRAFT_754242 [Colletotrichum acutatum]KAK1722560.1 hypothetical protein BDZ83DRAFT_754242 [Colletotrichum acutatum]
MTSYVPIIGDATFIVLRKGSIPANQSTNKKNLEVGRDSFIASQGEADPLLEKQNFNTDR